jgi:Skp family chaperone for outer membrane proteins
MPARILAAFIIGCSVLTASGAAPAQSGSEPAFAVVDFVSIRRNAQAAKAITEQLEGFIADYQGDLEKEEAALKTAQEKLDQERPRLPAGAYEEERQKWEQNVAEAQRRFLRRRQSIDRARTEAWEKVNQTLADVIRDVAAERRFQLILRRDQAVFVAPQLEITMEVLRRLDEVLPTVNVPMSDG